jgi:ATP-dependent Clp protease ATP-binding subunit ClpA
MNLEFHNIEHALLLHELESHLRSKIFGQDKAIETVVNKLTISYAGLTDRTKPLGSFLFTGPTGVGKTELAIELANKLDMHFERFDMSEYSSEYDAKNLVGGSAGLSGHESGGLLTNAIINNPKSVLLLDEIEKADPRIMHTFLQILDYGQLKSTKGEIAYFQDVIIIMTSNLGANEKPSVGFTKNNYNKEIAISEFLSPEFRARIDYTIDFNPLDEEMAKDITYKFIDNLSLMLEKKLIKLKVSTNLIEYLSEITLNQNEGARGVKKIIEEKIILKVSQEILFGELTSGGEVSISVSDDDTFVFNFPNKIDTTQKLVKFDNYDDALDFAKQHPGYILTHTKDYNGYVVNTTVENN